MHRPVLAALIVASTAFGACGYDFEQFALSDGGVVIGPDGQPITPGVDGASGPDGGGALDGSTPDPDAGVGDDGAVPVDGGTDAVVPVESGGPDGCTPSPGCLADAGNCALACAQTSADCQTACGTKNPCKAQCRNTEKTCRDSCMNVCNACLVATGCPSTLDCTTVTQ